MRNRLEPGKIDSRNIAGLLPEIDERNTVGRERFAADPLERQLVKADGPQDIVDKTIAKYLQAYELLTGKKLEA